MTKEITKTDNKVLNLAIRQLSEVFETELSQYIEKAWEADQDVILLDNLEEVIYLISARIMDIGNLAHEALENEDLNITNYKVCHEWSEDSVSFMILWRNIIFEIQKSLLLMSESQITMDSYQELKLRSKQVLKEASENYSVNLRKTLNHPEVPEKQILKLALKSNPWPVYKHKLAQIGPQSEALVAQFKTMWNTSGLYVLVKSNFHDDFDNQRTCVEQFKTSIKEITSSIEFEENVDIKELVKELTVLNERYLSDRTYQEMQKDLDADLKALPGKERIIIQHKGNKLAFEEINLKARTVSWLDSEILPLLNNFYVIRANIKNQFNLSLSNIKNRITANKDQGTDFEKTDLLNALSTFTKRVARSETEILSIKLEVEGQLKKFAIHKIYNGNFLNLSIASTLNQYNQTSRLRFNDVKEWVKKKAIFLQRLQEKVEMEERLSVSEKVVRVINARMPHEKSSHYTNMFMTKGYIGASFMVGRDNELEHIKSIIDNWNIRYRGAIMITGTRFSGKSLLAEVISHRYFPEKTLSLAPGKKVQLGGRQLDPTSSLIEQLDFVIKYGLQEKLLIYLDDLHEWHNEEISLLQNLRALTKTIDRYSNKFFFMVCLNNWQKEKLNDVLDLDSVFQAEINTDTVSLEELYQTVLIRHSATHTELMDTENNVLVTNKYIYNKLKPIYSETDGNIGEGLLRWSNDIVMYDDDKVKYTYHDFMLPTFLNSHNSVLLKTILFYGSINEYLLRKLFGPPFQDKYKPILQRMINVGLIVRNTSGNLEVNRIIANDIAGLVADDTDFTYLKKKNDN